MKTKEEILKMSRNELLVELKELQASSCGYCSYCTKQKTYNMLFAT